MSKNNNSRPLSPHLQIYKPQITSITSIMHRLTGVALYIGLIGFCWFIFYNVYVFDNGNSVPCDCIILKTFGYLIAFGFLFALYFHICNGVRHLFWDAGKGFELKTALITGKIVLTISLLLTISNIVFFFYG